MRCASGIPCALLISGRHEVQAQLGRIRVARGMKVELFQRIRALAKLEPVALDETKLNGMTIVDDGVGVLAQVLLSCGCRALMLPVMSMGDCWLPAEHAASVASRLPHFSGPASPA